MKTDSHLLLGQFLLRRWGSPAPGKRAAFLWGCVEPDYNYATYLRGFLRTGRPGGHGYDSRCPWLVRRLSALEKRRYLRLVDWFFLGQTLHYVADSFTHAHTPRFQESIGAHRAYEERLRGLLIQQMDELSQSETRKLPLAWMVCDAYVRYMGTEPSPETDLRTIVPLCCAIYRRVTACAVQKKGSCSPAAGNS